MEGQDRGSCHRTIAGATSRAPALVGWSVATNEVAARAGASHDVAAAPRPAELAGSGCVWSTAASADTHLAPDATVSFCEMNSSRIFECSIRRYNRERIDRGGW